jgi:L-lysine 6-transaminase
MLRFKRYLEIIEEDHLVENARIQGEFLLAEVEKLQAEFPTLVFEARGRGLMCAFDLAEAQMRDLLKQKCYDEGLILIGAGDRSIRFRPPLNISQDELKIGLNIIREQLKELKVRDY